MYPKFIINNGYLIAGRVFQHFELADDHTSTRGGGWWYMDEHNKMIWLYNKSLRFGAASREDLRDVVRNGNHEFDGFTFLHSYAHNLNDALKEAVPLN